jgi:hypothetical protein
VDDKIDDKRVKRCTIDDIEQVERVLKADEIYSCITDDGSLPVEDFTIKSVLENELHYFLMPNENMLVTMHPVNSITYECHVNVLDAGRNETLMQESRKVLEYIFYKTPCRKMIAFIPAKYQNVMRYVTRIGMSIEGILTKSYLKNEILYDQYVFGFTKKEYEKCQKQ